MRFLYVLPALLLLLACPTQQELKCGNGQLDVALGEQCDDGNTTFADGCSGTCQVEAFSRQIQWRVINGAQMEICPTLVGGFVLQATVVVDGATAPDPVPVMDGEGCTGTSAATIPADTAGLLAFLVDVNGGVLSEQVLSANDVLAVPGTFVITFAQDPERCDPAFDPDLDGLRGCEDQDCAGMGDCPPLIEAVCDDQLDDDGDGDTDCADPDCLEDPACDVGAGSIDRFAGGGSSSRTSLTLFPGGHAITGFGASAYTSTERWNLTTNAGATVERELRDTASSVSVGSQFPASGQVGATGGFILRWGASGAAAELVALIQGASFPREFMAVALDAAGDEWIAGTSLGGGGDTDLALTRVTPAGNLVDLDRAFRTAGDQVPVEIGERGGEVIIVGRDVTLGGIVALRHGAALDWYKRYDAPGVEAVRDWQPDLDPLAPVGGVVVGSLDTGLLLVRLSPTGAATAARFDVAGGTLAGESVTTFSDGTLVVLATYTPSGESPRPALVLVDPATFAVVDARAYAGNVGLRALAVDSGLAGVLVAAATTTYDVWRFSVDVFLELGVCGGVTSSNLTLTASTPTFTTTDVTATTSMLPTQLAGGTEDPVDTALTIEQVCQ